MIKILKVLVLISGLIIVTWSLINTLIISINAQDLNSGYNIPHYYSESYVELDERYRNEIILTNALALAPDNVTIGMTGGKWLLSNDVTIAENKHLFFDCDTYLYLPSNITLTVNGSLDSAGHCLIIDGYGTVTGNILNACIDPEWLGENIINGFNVPDCDEYATTNWVIWYVGDYFTNSIMPWTTNWVIDYVTNYFNTISLTNYASLITNNYFIDGVTNNMETLIVRSNMTVNGYDYTDFISERIFSAESVATNAISGPATYIPSWSSELYDYYNSFNLTNGVFSPPKNGYYLLFANTMVTVNVATEHLSTDMFFDINRAGSGKRFGYTTVTDNTTQRGIGNINLYYLTTNDAVEVAIYEESAIPMWVVHAYFNAIYLGEN